jgi:hypothetical protein
MQETACGFVGVLAAPRNLLRVATYELVERNPAAVLSKNLAKRELTLSDIDLAD